MIRLSVPGLDGGGRRGSIPFGHGGTAVRGPATALRLCRLRYVGWASQWQFAMYRASHDDYDESVFFTLRKGWPLPSIGGKQDAGHL
jgi:hypothetical protein